MRLNAKTLQDLVMQTIVAFGVRCQGEGVAGGGARGRRERVAQMDGRGMARAGGASGWSEGMARAGCLCRCMDYLVGPDYVGIAFGQQAATEQRGCDACCLRGTGMG